MLRRALLAAMVVVAAGAAVAETPRYQRELHGIKGGDDRIEVAAVQAPWSAMGRLNNGLGGHCSGTLIGPRLVATAAHCLFNPKTRRIIPAGSLTFVAGYDRGSYLKASKVARLHPSPDWSYDGGRTTIETRAHDWALLELVEPLGDEVGWVAIGPRPSQGMAVVAAGYGKDKAHIPTAHIGCHLVSERGDLFFNDCDAVQGDSGGPVMVWRDGVPQLVAINVAVIVSLGDLGVALGVGAFADEARRLGAAAVSQAGPLSRDLDPVIRARVEAR